MNSLSTKYKEEVVPVLSADFSIENPMAVPTIDKIVVNVGTGDSLRDKSKRDKIIEDFARITGQKPKIQAARLSVAGFSIRQGMPVGLTTTLRRDRMYSFLEKLIGIVLPRLRDFRGVKDTSFDKAGNFTLGLTEHTVFPEIDLGSIDKPHGLEITIVIKNSNPAKSKALLAGLGMPFVKKDN